MNDTGEVVIYDLEFTTWPGALEREWSGTDECRELTRIGAIRIDSETLQEKQFFDCIVKPSICQNVSDYFVQLTGLSHERLFQEGVDFLGAIQRFFTFVGLRPAMCFGKDALVILENFELKGFQYKAKRLSDDCEIKVQLNDLQPEIYSGPDPFSSAFTLNMYGIDAEKSERETSDGIVIEFGLDKGSPSKVEHFFTSYNLRPWFHKNALETKILKSGELAQLFGKTITTGVIHEPVYDIRSILAGAKELILNHGADNIFKFVV